MSELIIIHDSALDSLFMAKCLEGSVSSYEKEKEIYDHYEEAYKSYIEVIERLKRLISKSI